MTEEYQVSLYVTVFDKDRLRAAAKVEALKTMSAEDWEELRNTNYSKVAADLHMLLDPGTSPDGCQIESSEAAWLRGDDADDEESE